VKSRKSTGVDTGGISYGFDDPLRKKIERSVIVIFFLFMTFSFAFLPTGTSWGIASGGALSLVSFISLRVTLEKVFDGLCAGKKRVNAYIVVIYYLKLIVLFFSCLLLLKAGKVDIFGLAAGLFVVPAAMIYTGISLYISQYNQYKR